MDWTILANILGYAILAAIVAVIFAALSGSSLKDSVFLILAITFAGTILVALIWLALFLISL